MSKLNKYLSDNYQNFFDTDFSVTDPDLFQWIVLRTDVCDAHENLTCTDITLKRAHNFHCIFGNRFQPQFARLAKLAVLYDYAWKKMWTTKCTWNAKMFWHWVFLIWSLVTVMPRLKIKAYKSSFHWSAICK